MLTGNWVTKHKLSFPVEIFLTLPGLVILEYDFVSSLQNHTQLLTFMYIVWQIL